jgi:RNA polymerase sigma-70 factor (sigma-E family)
VSTGLDFASFYAAARPTLLRTTYAVTGDRQLAEDAVQVAFAQAYAAWWRVTRADDPTAYVRRIAINAALGHGRRAFFRRETSTDRLPDRPTDPGIDALERDEVWRAVQALPPRQRAVVVLRYYEQLDDDAIADLVGCSPATVRSHASRALKTLRLNSERQNLIHAEEKS